MTFAIPRVAPHVVSTVGLGKYRVTRSAARRESGNQDSCSRDKVQRRYRFPRLSFPSLVLTCTPARTLPPACVWLCICRVFVFLLYGGGPATGLGGLRAGTCNGTESCARNGKWIGSFAAIVAPPVRLWSGARWC